MPTLYQLDLRLLHLSRGYKAIVLDVVGLAKFGVERNATLFVLHIQLAVPILYLRRFIDFDELNAAVSSFYFRWRLRRRLRRR